MRIEAEVVLKSPCQCRAWIEDKLPWELPIKDRHTQEYWEGCRRAVEAGQPQEEYLRPYLFWEKAGTGKKLPNDIHKQIYDLAQNIEKGYNVLLVKFWQKYGPLINSKNNYVSVAEVKNALGFFRLLINLWGNVRHAEEAKIRQLLLVEKNEIENFITAIVGEERKEYRLYVIDCKPLMFSEYGQAVHDRGIYYIKLPAPVPQFNLLEYTHRVVKENLRRYLKTLRNFTDLDPLTHRITMTPPDVMTSALLAFWEDMEKMTPAKKMRIKRQKGETVKDDVLAKYRMWKNPKRGRITQEDYDKLKGYADRIYHEGMSKEKFSEKMNWYYKRYVEKH